MVRPWYIMCGSVAAIVTAAANDHVAPHANNRTSVWSKEDFNNGAEAVRVFFCVAAMLVVAVVVDNGREGGRHPRFPSPFHGAAYLHHSIYEYLPLLNLVSSSVRSKICVNY